LYLQVYHYDNTLFSNYINQYHVAGTRTTVAAIHTFFLAMVCFPEVQMKAQAELDRVLDGRLPDFGDMDDLAYLSALVKEVLRSVTLLPSNDENAQN